MGSSTLCRTCGRSSARRTLEAVIVDESGEIRVLVAEQVIAEARQAALHRPNPIQSPRWARLRYLLSIHDLDPQKTGPATIAELARLVQLLKGYDT